MILTLATYPPSMMACTPTPSLSSLRQNYLASLQHRLTILQLRLRGDIMELEAGDSEPHMVTSPTSKLRPIHGPIFDFGNFCTKLHHIAADLPPAVAVRCPRRLWSTHLSSTRACSAGGR